MEHVTNPNQENIQERVNVIKSVNFVSSDSLKRFDFDIRWTDDFIVKNPNEYVSFIKEHLTEIHFYFSSSNFNESFRNYLSSLDFIDNCSFTLHNGNEHMVQITLVEDKYGIIKSFVDLLERFNSYLSSNGYLFFRLNMFFDFKILNISGEEHSGMTLKLSTLRSCRVYEKDGNTYYDFYINISKVEKLSGLLELEYNLPF